MNSSITATETASFEPLALGLFDYAAAGTTAEAAHKASTTPVDFLLRRSWERRFSRAVQALRRM